MSLAGFLKIIIVIVFSLPLLMPITYLFRFFRASKRCFSIVTDTVGHDWRTDYFRIIYRASMKGYTKNAFSRFLLSPTTTH